jgi:SAM-dependent methyltransferase
MPYLMEDPREASRLAEKVNPARWVSRYLSHLPDGARWVLDVGCGPGVIAAALARRHRAVRVVGLDVSSDRLKRLSRKGPSPLMPALHQGDIYRLPFVSDSFDVVYSRFLFQYLVDKTAGVQEMTRVCRPGGHVLLQDLDGQLVWHHPIVANLERRLHGLLRRLEPTGFDVFVGRKLFALAQRAGLHDVGVRIEPYHVIAGAPGSDVLRLWRLKLDIALPSLAASLGSPTAARRLCADFLGHLRRPDTLTFSVMFTVSGTKR